MRTLARFRSALVVADELPSGHSSGGHQLEVVLNEDPAREFDDYLQ